MWIFEGPIDPTLTLAPSDAAWTITGRAARHAFGVHVWTLPDIDGDGVEDVAAFGGQTVFVFHGALASETTEMYDIAVYSDRAGDLDSFAPLGDVDGDGIDDYAAGASDHSHTSENDGKAWILHGPLATGLDPQRDYPQLIEDEGAAGLGDELGAAVAAAGDVDADGYADVLIGAPTDSEGASLGGAAWLVYGPVPRNLADLQDLDAVKFLGQTADDEAGAAVAGVGDLDGDGYDDVVIGAPGYAPGASDEGAAYLWYGPVAAGTVELSDADAVFLGQPSDRLGAALGGPVDIDGDGYDDLVMGAPGPSAGTTSNSKVYVYYGGPRTSPVTAAVPTARSASDDADGDGWTLDAGDCYDADATVYPGATETCGDSLDSDCDGFDVRCPWTGTLAVGDEYDAMMSTSRTSTTLGAAIAGIADLDGDGEGEWAIGQGGSSPYVHLLAGAPPHGAYALSADGTILEEVANDTLGRKLVADDFDGDGLDDLAVASAARTYGAVYVWNGTQAWSSGASAGDALSIVDGIAATDNFAAGLCAPGDLDGDGASDMVAGASGSNTAALHAGEVYVFYGPLDAGRSTAGEADASWTGESADVNASRCAGADDVDGDGLPDLVVGVPAGNAGAGRAYVVAGGAYSGTRSLSTADAVVEGDADDALGASSGVGDMDDDGRDDLLVGAPSYGVAGDGGSAFLFSGVDLAGTLATGDAALELAGTTAYDGAGAAVASAGDWNGDGEPDLMVAAPGSDLGANAGGAVYLSYGPLTSTGSQDVALADVIFTGRYNDDLGEGWIGDVGDLDGDGINEIAMASGDTSSASVWVFYGGSD